MADGNKSIKEIVIITELEKDKEKAIIFSFLNGKNIIKYPRIVERPAILVKIKLKNILFIVNYMREQSN